MTDWRGKILSEFTPGTGKPLLAVDPDRLLAEPAIQQTLRERGFDMLTYEDPLSFRLAYELKYRQEADAGRSADVVFWFCADAEASARLPYDVLARCRRVVFGLDGVFPSLSYPVLAAVGAEYLDAVYEAQRRAAPGRLGENATKDFLLLHVFEIAPELIRSDTDLLRTLLRRHYRQQSLPVVLLDRLTEVLSRGGRFTEWPLCAMFLDRAMFLAFLQERWVRFVARKVLRKTDFSAESPLVVQGPEELPFEHPDVRVYIDNLFVEGLLEPVEIGLEITGQEAWIECGIVTRTWDDRRRWLALLDLVEQSIPQADARHSVWLDFGQKWAQLNSHQFAGEDGASVTPVDRLVELRRQVDSSLETWLLGRFGGLSNLPSDPRRSCFTTYRATLPRYATWDGLSASPCSWSTGSPGISGFWCGRRWRSRSAVGRSLNPACSRGFRR